MANNERLELDLLALRSGRPQMRIDTETPYRDDPENEGFGDISEEEGEDSEREPPKYEPMFEYLRQRSASYPPPQTSNESSIQEPYRDEPFIVTIDPNQPSYPDSEPDEPPPPSYEYLCRQNELEMRLMNEFGLDEAPAEQTEELVKWVVAMLLIGLTVAGVGTAFNWGREKGCGWGGVC